MPRREFVGTIVSDVCDKTVVVKVETMVKHPVYKKFVKRSRKFSAHDEQNAYKTGDKVLIRECRPISKRKTWEVIERSA
jgi:small subunit ribosomal protein S17